MELLPGLSAPRSVVSDALAMMYVPCLHAKAAAQAAAAGEEEFGARRRYELRAALDANRNRARLARCNFLPLDFCEPYTFECQEAQDSLPIRVCDRWATSDTCSLCRALGRKQSQSAAALQLTNE